LETRTPGKYQTEVEIPAEWLNIGRYTVSVYIANASSGQVFDSVEAITFNIIDTGAPGSRNGVQRRGVLQPLLDWHTSSVTQ